jgi:putative methyltransferase (TIGR04325 family)
MTDLLHPDACPIGGTPQAPYFFGCFSEHENIGADPFASEAWKAHSQALAASFARPEPWFTFRSLARTVLHGHHALASEHAGLFRTVKAMLKTRERVRILDVGGGCGENYIALVRALGDRAAALDYLVIENEQNCRLGRSLFPDASFATAIPDVHFDLAAVIGTLQYIPDWRGMLATLKARCNMVLLARSPLRVSGPSFFTRQAICPAMGDKAGTKAGTAEVIVISLDELRGEMSDWEVVEDRFVADYSPHFARLPSPYQNVEYRSMAWVRPA